MATDSFLHEKAYRGSDYTDRLDRLVTLCGAGAVGSNLADHLARLGFRALRAIDFDRIEGHNIGPQIWTATEIGMLKVQALMRRLFATTGISLETYDKRMDDGNVNRMLKGSELIVDAFDNAESRQLVQDKVRMLKVPCLHIGLAEDYAEIVWDENYRVPKAHDSSVCDYPLTRSMVMLAISVAAEELLDHFLAKKPRHASWTITLGDLAIRRVR